MSKEWKFAKKGSRGVMCKCGKFTPFDGYAVAQNAMGHELQLGCPTCRRLIIIPSRAISRAIQSLRLRRARR